jgi:hypothetical protein
VTNGPCAFGHCGPRRPCRAGSFCATNVAARGPDSVRWRCLPSAPDRSARTCGPPSTPAAARTTAGRGTRGHGAPRTRRTHRRDEQRRRPERLPDGNRIGGRVVGHGRGALTPTSRPKASRSASVRQVLPRALTTFRPIRRGRDQGSRRRRHVLKPVRRGPDWLAGLDDEWLSPWQMVGSRAPAPRQRRQARHELPRHRPPNHRRSVPPGRRTRVTRLLAIVGAPASSLRERKAQRPSIIAGPLNPRARRARASGCGFWCFGGGTTHPTPQSGSGRAAVGAG